MRTIPNYVSKSDTAAARRTPHAGHLSDFTRHCVKCRTRRREDGSSIGDGRLPAPKPHRRKREAPLKNAAVLRPRPIAPDTNDIDSYFVSKPNLIGF